MAARTTSLKFVSTLFLSLFLNYETALGLMMNSSTEVIGCSKMEREALFKFKGGLKDPSGRLSSWVGQDCCAWKGVSCSGRTGAVVKLDLSNKAPTYFYADDQYYLSLGGTLNPSLLQLKQLRFLNLSKNHFVEAAIPEFLGSLEKLVYLDLSYASFIGMVPPHLGNLSNLRYLDLGHLFGCKVSDLNWISRLSSLEYLNLDSMNLSLTTTHWLQALNMLPALTELHLSYCGLERFPHYLPYLNLTFLSIIDLSNNNFSSSVPQYLLNMSSSLRELNLDSCQLKGLFAQLVRGDFCNIRRLKLGGNDINCEVGVLLTGLSRCNTIVLEELDLPFSQLYGQLPATSLEHFSVKLRVLSLEHNRISGPLPASISRLSNLEVLNLGENNMNGSIPESSFQKLTKLSSLNLNGWQGISLSENHFVGLTSLKDLSTSFYSSSTHHDCQFNLSNNWDPPFSLESLYIDGCLVGPAFPAWLEKQTQLLKLMLKNAGIESAIPPWFWKLSHRMGYIDFSDNQIRGTLPCSLDFPSWTDTSIRLSNNRLEGTLPLWSNVPILYLNGNRFSGSIPGNIGQIMFWTEYLDLSGNLITGRIPNSMGKLKNLFRLYLSNNNLSGHIPDIWTSMQSLGALDLSGNKFSGNIPASLCTSSSLQLLKLSSNNFSGELPFSLRHCTGLETLDLGNNKFSGQIPQWLGESLSSLSLLRLRGNRFTGKIPQNLCHLPWLHLLDLSLNNLSGPIPQCLGNLSAFISSSKRSLVFGTTESIVKGTSYEYSNLLDRILYLIDLSNNNLTGEIPEEVTKLMLLSTLNLSRNQLTGGIPEKIGNLKLVETLDLSWNHLRGVIPTSMISMTSLSYLNLSYNNLSGTIPSDNQFLTFGDSVFSGNPGLCRLPPTNGYEYKPSVWELEADLCYEAEGNHVPLCGEENKCKGPHQAKRSDGEEKNENLGVYISSILGFLVGFWAVCGSLAIKESWRLAFFGFMGKMNDRLVVFVSVKVNKIMGRERL